ncbi:hypothetical protein B9Z55_011745 [Caenorhabditis nigoni]|nr:hypothetical protein B9Z55_011745 [Caenorhabditis nigoni]
MLTQIFTFLVQLGTVLAFTSAWMLQKQWIAGGWYISGVSHVAFTLGSIGAARCFWFLVPSERSSEWKEFYSVIMQYAVSWAVMITLDYNAKAIEGYVFHLEWIDLFFVLGWIIYGFWLRRFWIDWRTDAEMPVAPSMQDDHRKDDDDQQAVAQNVNTLRRLDIEACTGSEMKEARSNSDPGIVRQRAS